MGTLYMSVQLSLKKAQHGRILRLFCQSHSAGLGKDKANLTPALLRQSTNITYVL